MMLGLILLLLATQPHVDMVVTVERQAQAADEAAAAVTVIRREDLQKLPATNLGDALAFVPGLTMLVDPAAGAPVITSRGFFGGGEVEYVKLLVDGVPVADAESGLADWPRFRLADVERIEVMHGPGSAMYGDTALGGVIQIFTRHDAGGDLLVSAGSDGDREAEGGWATMVGTVRLAARGDLATLGGYRDHSSRDDRGASITASGERWRVVLDSSRKDRDEPGPLTRAQIAFDRTQVNPLFRSDRERTSRDRLSASWSSDAFHVVGWRARRDSDNLRTILFTPSFGTRALQKRDTRETGTMFDVSHGALHAGADLARATLHGDYDGKRDTIGAFLTGAWDVCSGCRLTLGVRRDEIRDDFSSHSRNSATSPRAGLTIRRGGVNVFAQASQAFKAATLNQLFDPRSFSGFTISNPALRPQRARNYEAGLRAAHWSLVAYRMKVKDEIDFDPRTFSYRNLGRSTHRGVEASVTREMRVKPTLTYSWTRVSDDAAPHDQLKNIPEHVAQLMLETPLPFGTTGAATYRWMRGLFLDDAGRFPLGDVSRVDLRISKPIGRARIDVDVLNALDSRYSDFGYVLANTALEYPAPGRRVRVGVGWGF